MFHSDGSTAVTTDGNSMDFSIEASTEYDAEHPRLYPSSEHPQLITTGAYAMAPVALSRRSYSTSHFDHLLNQQHHNQHHDHRHYAQQNSHHQQPHHHHQQQLQLQQRQPLPGGSISQTFGQDSFAEFGAAGLSLGLGGMGDWDGHEAFTSGGTGNGGNGRYLLNGDGGAWISGDGGWIQQLGIPLLDVSRSGSGGDGDGWTPTEDSGTTELFDAAAMPLDLTNANIAHSHMSANLLPTSINPPASPMRILNMLQPARVGIISDLRRPSHGTLISTVGAIRSNVAAAAHADNNMNVSHHSIGNMNAAFRANPPLHVPFVPRTNVERYAVRLAKLILELNANAVPVFRSETATCSDDAGGTTVATAPNQPQEVSSQVLDPFRTMQSSEGHAPTTSTPRDVEFVYQSPQQNAIDAIALHILASKSSPNPQSMSLPYIKDSSIHRPLQPGECLSEWATKTMLHGTSRSPGVATGVPIPSPSTPSSQLTQVITTPYSTDHLDLDDATLARNAGLDLATLDRSALRRLRNKISAARCRARKRMYQEKVARTEEGLRRLAGEVEAHVVELEGERAALMGRFMDRGLADLGESVGSSTQ